MTAAHGNVQGRHWKETFSTFYAAWQFLDDRVDREPAQQVAEDGRLARTRFERASSDRAAPLFRVWTNRRCLVVTRREERLPKFQEAAERSAGRGWPVILRDSGGTTVPHPTGALQLTLILPRLEGHEPGTDQVYRFLCEPVREALAELGVATGYGEVPGSFCDGRFNLVAGGRKVAGTAQRWWGGIPGNPVRPGAILAHLTLFVEGDLAEATGAVNRLLEEAGGEGRFDPAATITVQEAARRAPLQRPSPDSSLEPTGERAGDPAVEAVRAGLAAVLAS